MHPSHTDDTLLQELGLRLSRYRIEAGFTQAELAYEAGISKRTLERMEAGSSTQLSSLVRVLRALALVDHLDALIPDTVPSPMKELMGTEHVRKRASRKKSPTPLGPWTWGDES